MNVAQPVDCARTIFRDLGYERENQPTIYQEFEIFGFLQIYYISEKLTLWVAYSMMKAELPRINANKK